MVVILTFVIIGVGYGQGIWTWDGTGFDGASLWDWLDLLIVPVVLGVGGIWLQREQRKRELAMQEDQRQREREADERQRQRELDIENERRQRELDVEDQRAQDIALQTYLDQMGRLLLELKLQYGSPEDPLSIFARVQTLTTLGRLDSKRKRSVVQFLFEAGLIYNRYRPQEVRGHLVVSLRGLI